MICFRIAKHQVVLENPSSRIPGHMISPMEYSFVHSLAIFSNAVLSTFHCRAISGTRGDDTLSELSNIDCSPSIEHIDINQSAIVMAGANPL